MDVLVVLRRAGDVGEVSAGAVLAALGSGRRAAGVHQEQRRLGGHRDRLDHASRGSRCSSSSTKKSRPVDHRALRRVLAGVPSPDQHLVDLDTDVSRAVATASSALALWSSSSPLR